MFETYGPSICGMNTHLQYRYFGRKAGYQGERTHNDIHVWCAPVIDVGFLIPMKENYVNSLCQYIISTVNSSYVSLNINFAIINQL